MVNEIRRLTKNFAAEVNDLYEESKIEAYLFVLAALLILFCLSMPFIISGWWGFLFYGIFIFIFFAISVLLKLIVWYGKRP